MFETFFYFFMPQPVLSKSSEDYLEAIGHLVRLHGAAQISDIAAFLKVKKPSVTSAVRLLAELKLVEYTQYAPVRLTAKGKKMADRIIHAHETLQKFLHDVAGLSLERSDAAACLIEHVLTPEEIERIGRVTRCLEAHPCMKGELQGEE